MERDPLTKLSKCSHERLTREITRSYHAMVRDDVRRWYLCGCAKAIRGQDPTVWSKLRRNARRDDMWASNCRWR